MMNTKLWKPVLLLLLFTGICLPVSVFVDAYAQDGDWPNPLPKTNSSPDKELPANMHSVYQAFRELQPFLYDKDAFNDPKNAARIQELLGIMSTRFHKVEGMESAHAQEPGFASTLKVLNDMLDDAHNRFDEGKKGYALWRLRTSSNYCVACHTRFEVKVDFYDPTVNLDGLNSYERGELLLASRQFERARDEFLVAVKDPALVAQRMEALRKWLVIYTRVTPDPREALTELSRIRTRAALSRYEDEEVQGWLESLRRWEGESKVAVDPLAKAENLIRQGLAMDDPLYGRKGTVELLRATAILHRLLDNMTQENKVNRGRVLYLLGLAYSELPFFFINELPEMFLEQCIRENPGTDDAKRAYLLYKEIVNVAYTGSGGTRLPDDVIAELKELHDIAYGIPQVRGRV